MCEVLKDKTMVGAAIDVYIHGPYQGILSLDDNCILAAHMGFTTIDCRTRVEIGATKDAVRFTTGNI